MATATDAAGRLGAVEAAVAELDNADAAGGVGPSDLGAAANSAAASKILPSNVFRTRLALALDLGTAAPSACSGPTL